MTALALGFDELLLLRINFVGVESLLSSGPSRLILALSPSQPPPPGVFQAKPKRRGA